MHTFSIKPLEGWWELRLKFSWKSAEISWNQQLTTADIHLLRQVRKKVRESFINRKYKKEGKDTFPMSVWGVHSPVSVFPHLKLGRIFFEENLLKNIFFRRKYFLLKETLSFKRFHSFEWDNILYRCCDWNWKVLNKKNSHIRQRRLSTW